MRIDKLLLLLTIFFVGFTNITVVYALDKHQTKINSVKKDVTGDHRTELIEVIKQGSSTKLFISDNKHRLASYALGKNTFKTNLTVQDLTQDGIKDIFVTFVNKENNQEQYLLLAFENQQLISIPLPETVDITAQFENNYQASININQTKQSYTLNLRHRKEKLEKNGVYHHGALNEPMELIVSSIQSHQLIRLKDLSFGLKGRQVVDEGYGGVKIAFVDSTWKRVNGEWELQKTSVKKLRKK